MTFTSTMHSFLLPQPFPCFYLQLFLLQLPVIINIYFIFWTRVQHCSIFCLTQYVWSTYSSLSLSSSTLSKSFHFKRCICLNTKTTHVLSNTGSHCHVMSQTSNTKLREIIRQTFTIISQAPRAELEFGGWSLVQGYSQIIDGLPSPNDQSINTNWQFNIHQSLTPMFHASTAPGQTGMVVMAFWHNHLVAQMTSPFTL